LYDVLRIFFVVKSKSNTLLTKKHTTHEHEHHYKLKLSSDFVLYMGVMNSICCYPCKRMSKHHMMVDGILEKGEEKLKDYINAEFIFETLQKH
jgi:hypothetical protein